MLTDMFEFVLARLIYCESYLPIHLLVRDEAEILKNVDFDWEAIHFPIRVFPVPIRQIVTAFVQVVSNCVCIKLRFYGQLIVN